MSIVLRGSIIRYLPSKILLMFVMAIVTMTSIILAARLSYASDLTAPISPMPLDGAVIRGDDYTQRWSAVTGAAKYEYESYYDAAGLLLKFSAVYTTNAKPTSNISDSVYWWRVRAVDSGGARSQWSPLWKLTIDNTAPVASLTSTGTGLVAGYYRGNVIVTGTVGSKEKNMASHAFVVTRPDGTLVSTGQIVDPTLTRTYAVDTSVGDGVYRVKYTATDKAGNASTPVETSFTVDTAPPSAGPALTGDAVRYMRPGAVTRSWAASLSSDAYAYHYKSFKSYNDAANNLETTDHYFAYTWTANSQSTYSLVSETGTSERVFYYRVAALDKAGNKTWSDQIYSVTVDATAPVSVLNDLGATPLHSTVDVAGTVSDNYLLHGYNLSLYPGSVDLSDGGEHISDRIAIEGSDWTGGDVDVTGTTTPIARELDTTKLANGNYQVRLVATDEAGSVSVPVTRSFTVENTSPVVAPVNEPPVVSPALLIPGDGDTTTPTNTNTNTSNTTTTAAAEGSTVAETALANSVNRTPAVGGGDDEDNAEVAVIDGGVKLSPADESNGKTSTPSAPTGQEVKGVSTTNWRYEIGYWGLLLVAFIAAAAAWLLARRKRRGNAA